MEYCLAVYWWQDHKELPNVKVFAKFCVMLMPPSDTDVMIGDNFLYLLSFMLEHLQKYLALVF